MRKLKLFSFVCHIKNIYYIEHIDMIYRIMLTNNFLKINFHVNDKNLLTRSTNFYKNNEIVTIFFFLFCSAI